jgi:hypothetical protein
MYHDRCQEEKPKVAVKFIEFEVCLVPHQAVRELESRRAAARKKDKYPQYDVRYAEGQNYAQGC